MKAKTLLTVPIIVTYVLAFVIAGVAYFNTDNKTGIFVALITIIGSIWSHIVTVMEVRDTLSRNTSTLRELQKAVPKVERKWIHTFRAYLLPLYPFGISALERDAVVEVRYVEWTQNGTTHTMAVRFTENDLHTTDGIPSCKYS